MQLDRIISLFALFSDLDGDALSAWQGLCGSAASRLEACLRADANAALEMEALCTAAAACAYCDYLALRSSGANDDEIRVGEISVKRASSAALSDACNLRNHFLEDVAHLLEPKCPVLLTTGGV